MKSIRKVPSALLSIVIPLFMGVSAIAQEATPNSLDPIDSKAFSIMQQFFDYDTGIPLEALIVAKHKEEGYVREKVVFRGIRNSRVPGYLAIPKVGPGPFPCVLLLHGISSSKDSWWDPDSFSSGGRLTEKLLNSGVAVMTLDAEYHGERLGNNDYESAEVFVFQKGWLMRARDMIVQSVIEHRRALDYLASREEINMERIGLAGYSMGGMMVFQLSATDTRVRAAVACVSPILKQPGSAIAIYNFAPFSGDTAMQMLVGEKDSSNYSPEDARQLHQLIQGGDKELEFFDSGHRLPPEWTENAAEWLVSRLK